MKMPSSAFSTFEVHQEGLDSKAISDDEIELPFDGDLLDHADERVRILGGANVSEGDTADTVVLGRRAVLRSRITLPESIVGLHQLYKMTSATASAEMSLLEQRFGLNNRLERYALVRRFIREHHEE